MPNSNAQSVFSANSGVNAPLDSGIIPLPNVNGAITVICVTSAIVASGNCRIVDQDGLELALFNLAQAQALTMVCVFGVEGGFACGFGSSQQFSFDGGGATYHNSKQGNKLQAIRVLVTALGVGISSFVSIIAEVP